MSIKVSVVIPVYGVEKYIERCVRSLFEQTLDSIEYIFVDDCTPDNSIAVMEKVLAEYPQRQDQVKIIRHEVNQGVGAARNHGVAACTGDYVIHCDPDDWVDLNMYEKLYNKAVETDADMVMCFFEEHKENLVTRVSMQTYSEIHDLFKEYFNTAVFNSLWNKIFRASVAKSPMIIPDEIIMGEDLLRVSQMLMRCKKISYETTVFYHYFRNETSMTNVFNIQYHHGALKIINILKDVMPCDLAYLLDSVSMGMLYDSIRYSCKEYDFLFTCYWGRDYWRSTKRGIYKDRRITVARKIILYCGCINYRLACRLFPMFNKLKAIIRK